MVRIELDLSEDGCLMALRARGHAVGALGANVPCAAVSILLRTAARYLAEEGYMRAGGAPATGEMDFRLQDKEVPGKERLRGATGLLLRGLSDLSREYPQDVEISVRPGR